MITGTMAIFTHCAMVVQIYSRGARSSRKNVANGMEIVIDKDEPVKPDKHRKLHRLVNDTASTVYM